MKNKKGVSIGRILLYVLFLSLVGVFIYTLYITFKSMKKEPVTTNEQVNSSLRFAYNNTYQYSAADYLERTNLYFYRIPDALNDLPSFNNTTGKNYAYSIASYPYWTVTSSGYSWNWSSTVNDTYPFVYWADSSYSSYSPVISDNVLNVSSSINTIGNLALNNTVYGSPTYANWFNVFKDTSVNYPGGSHQGGSFGIQYSCNIPVNIFKGSLSGSSINSQVKLIFVTDKQVNSDGSISSISELQYFTLDSSNNFSFDFQELTLSAENVGCSYIKYFFFFISGSWNPNTRYNDWLVNPNQNFNSMSSVWLNSLDVSLTFDIFEGSSDYQSGYEQGFSDGVKQIDEQMNQAYNDMLVQNTALSLQIQDLNDRIQTQSNLISQMQEQLNSSGNFKNLFFTMADIPFKTVHSALGFEFWGVNLFRFFTGVLTALGIVWLIKKIL